jgi:hypothetical protein
MLVVSFTSGPFYSKGKNPCTIGWEAGWTPEPVWTLWRREKFVLPGIETQHTKLQLETAKGYLGADGSMLLKCASEMWFTFEVMGWFIWLTTGTIDWLLWTMFILTSWTALSLSLSLFSLLFRLAVIIIIIIIIIDLDLWAFVIICAAALWSYSCSLLERGSWKGGLLTLTLPDKTKFIIMYIFSA